MTSYKCIRCGYSTNHKGTFIRHIERVRQCKAIEQNASKNDIYKHNLMFDKITENTTLTENCQRNVNVMSTLSTLCQRSEKCQRSVNVGGKMSTLNEDVGGKMSTFKEDVVNVASTLTQTHQRNVNVKCQCCQRRVNVESIITQKIKKLSPESLDKKKKKIYKCKYCDKQFNTRQSKSRHEKESCPTKHTKNQLLKKLQEKQMNALFDTLPYENTNRQFLTDDMISSCMERQNRCVPEIIKLVHFNIDYPENRNLYIRNIKTGYIIAYDGQDWVLKDNNDMLDKIISDNENFMHTKFMEWYDDNTKKKKYKKALAKFTKYLNNSSNENLIKNVKNELKIMLYNIKNKIGTSDFLVTELKD